MVENGGYDASWLWVWGILWNGIMASWTMIHSCAVSRGVGHGARASTPNRSPKTTAQEY